MAAWHFRFPKQVAGRAKMCWCFFVFRDPIRHGAAEAGPVARYGGSDAGQPCQTAEAEKGLFIRDALFSHDAVALHAIRPFILANSLTQNRKNFAWIPQGPPSLRVGRRT